ncbi:MAG: hypothetical protein ACQKBV_12400 [Puniceicoccales bacterium]
MKAYRGLFIVFALVALLLVRETVTRMGQIQSQAETVRTARMANAMYRQSLDVLRAKETQLRRDIGAMENNLAGWREQVAVDPVTVLGEVITGASNNSLGVTQSVTKPYTPEQAAPNVRDGHTITIGAVGAFHNNLRFVGIVEARYPSMRVESLEMRPGAEESELVAMTFTGFLPAFHLETTQP